MQHKIIKTFYKGWIIEKQRLPPIIVSVIAKYFDLVIAQY